MACCPTCATPLPADALFCPRCGASTPTGISKETGATTFAQPAAGDDAGLAARRAALQHALGAAFEVRDLVGQGGFGEVWAAADVKLKRDVAVKVLRADLVASPSLLERFRREAEAAARLRHPNIVPIYQVGEAEGLVYFVMPLVKGESLRAVLEREGRVDVAEAVRILTEATSALHEAHEAGIVHRDVKPDNILLEGPQRRVLLMDFGIAKSLEAADGGLTGTGMVVGTPQYMSPEQATGEKLIDARSDLYSLGVVAYQMLTGRFPFDADSAQGMIAAHIATPPEPIAQVLPAVPEDLAAAVMRALAKKPDARWASAAEFAAAIRPPTPVSEESPVRWVTKRLRRSVRSARRRLVWYAAAFAVLLVAAAGADPGAFAAAWRYWRTLGEPQPGSPSWIAVVEPFQGMVVSRDVGLGEVDVAPFVDGIVVLARGAAPATFDGTTWRTLDVTGRVASVPVELDGTVWLFSSEGRRTVAYAVAGSTVTARDTIPGAVVKAWGSGSDILLALQDGGMLRGRPGAWRREPTGTRTPLLILTGDRRRQIGIGVFARGGADSLLVFNGLNWHTVDPRPDSSRFWIYDAAGALPDGTLLVVGQDCGSYRMEACRGLVTRLAPGSDAWTANDRGMPDDVDFVGVLAESQDVIWLFGRGAGCGTPTCIFRDSAGRLEPGPTLGNAFVFAAGMLGGEPLFVTRSGAVWTRRNGTFGVLGEVPSSVYGGVAVPPLSAYFGSRWHPSDRPALGYGDGTVVLAGQRGIRRMVFGDAGVDRVRSWALTTAGAIVEGDCTLTYRLVCEPLRLSAATGSRPWTDIALLDGELIAGDGTGRLVRWRGGTWQPMATPGRPAGVIALAAGRGQVAAVLTATAVWRWDAVRGGVWREWARLPDWLGQPRGLAVHPQGRGAAVLGDRTVAILQPEGGMEELQGMCAAPADVAVLDDGRIAVACPTPEDPLLGGELLVSSPLDRPPLSVQRVGLGPYDAYALAYSDGVLFGAGAGWGTGSMSVERLPFRDTSATGTVTLAGVLPSGGRLLVDDSLRQGPTFSTRAGLRWIRIEAPGFAPMAAEVYVPPGGSVRVDVRLRPLPAPERR